MKRYILLSAFLLMASTWVTITAQDIDIKVEILNSDSNELSFDMIITVIQGQPDFKVYLYDFDRPPWKGGQPMQSVTAGISEEIKLTDIPSGKYYLIAEDAGNNATIKLIDLKTNVQQ
jgi:hypothetical protein